MAEDTRNTDRPGTLTYYHGGDPRKPRRGWSRDISKEMTESAAVYDEEQIKSGEIAVWRSDDDPDVVRVFGTYNDVQEFLARAEDGRRIRDIIETRSRPPAFRSALDNKIAALWAWTQSDGFVSDMVYEIARDLDDALGPGVGTDLSAVDFIIGRDNNWRRAVLEESNWPFQGIGDDDKTPPPATQRKPEGVGR